MSPIELGKFIATLRNEKNLTQEELSEKLFIDKRKISRWECGMSIPDFDMLIKLSEILDVSLYELSICKRIESEKLSKKILNRFKSIKDYKKYTARKIALIVFQLILLAFFILTTIYTFKYNNTIEIYEFSGNNENMYVEGNYIRVKEKQFINVAKIVFISDITNPIYDKCSYEIIQNDTRIIYFDNDDIIDDHYLNAQTKIPLSSDSLYFKSICHSKINELNEESFDLDLEKKYTNKFF